MAPSVSPWPLTPLPSSTINGCALLPGWLAPSITTASVIVGKALPIKSVYSPSPPAGPVIAKRIVSSPGVLFEAIKASRSDTAPSVPMRALSCSMVKLPPRPVSLVSATVPTTSCDDTSVTRTVMACSSNQVPSLDRTITS